MNTRRYSLGLAIVGSATFLLVRAVGVSGDAYLNRDLSTNDLSQWMHRDYGFGTDSGGNNSSGGYLWFHPNVAGRKAAGLTVTPTSHASPAAGSDSVFLWENSQFWNRHPYSIWLRTSVLFPSDATIRAVGLPGEQSFQPTTGTWNWFLEFHNDSNPVPPCSKELANVSMGIVTDDTPRTAVVGTRNVHLMVRIMGGDDCSPESVTVNGPSLALDHWYEILLHVGWDPAHGVFQWYLDDFERPYYQTSDIPTLFTRPSGYVSPSYTSLTVANYRWHAPWSSTIYFGPLVVTNTRLDALRPL